MLIFVSRLFIMFGAPGLFLRYAISPHFSSEFIEPCVSPEAISLATLSTLLVPNCLLTELQAAVPTAVIAVRISTSLSDAPSHSASKALFPMLNALTIFNF